MHLELVRSAQLVRGTDPNPTEVFEAYHDRAREAVLANLAPAAKRDAHERLARALEASETSDDEALATHWREAGDAARAATFAVRAANAAMAGFAFDHATDLYRLALELDPPSGAAAVTLRARLGEALASAGRGAESGHAYLRAAEVAAPDEALSLKERAASQLMRAGHMDEGMAVVRDVLAAVGMSVPRTPLRALASFLFRRILVRLRGFKFKERAAGEIAPHKLLVLDLLSSLSFLLSFVDTMRGGDFQARYIVLALDAGEPYRILRAFGSEAPYSVSIGMQGWPHAQAAMARARALADKLGDQRSTAYVTAASGIASYLAGRFRESVLLCDEAVASQASGVFAERMRARQFACYSLSLMGEFAELGRRLPEHLRDAEARGDVYLSTNLLVGLPHVTWLVQGDVEGARAGVAAAKARWSAEGFTLETYYTMFAEVQTELYVGAPDVAWRVLLDRWPALRRSFLLRIQTVRFMALHARARAAIALAERDPSQRATLLADAERSAGQLA
jgi:tetratricopeptide (TPR) repeat protein